MVLRGHLLPQISYLNFLFQMLSGGMDGMTYILKGYVKKVGVENKMNNNGNNSVASPCLKGLVFSIGVICRCNVRKIVNIFLYFL